ncbi:MAG: hypothetical protein K2N94_10830 [Lachnospiraceae bacterium]|nr:hypothetical protein [Lachnospiraceae bacterium]
MKRKVLATLCAAVMTVSAVSVAAPEPVKAAPAPLVSFDFEDGFGDMTPAAKGETAAPVIVANDVKGNAVQLEFGGHAAAESYTTFANPFAGKELSAATISLWVNIPETAPFWEWDSLIGFSDFDAVNDPDGPGARLTLEARPYLCWNAGGADNWIDLKTKNLAFADGDKAVYNNLGKWQHYAVVITPEGQTLYVNGEAVTETEVNNGEGLDNASLLTFLSSENTNAYLGLGSFWGSQGALLDDIAFYDAALTADEIKEAAGIADVLAAQPAIELPPVVVVEPVVKIDLSTITAAVPAGYTAYYKFDGNMKDEVTGQEGVTVGLKYCDPEFVPTSYDTGVKGQALVFDGLGGAKLPVGPTSKQYTISSNWYIAKAVRYSPTIFLTNLYDNGILRGEDTDAQWISISPLGWRENIADGPMIWSRNVPGDKAWNDCTRDGNESITTGQWYNITVVADADSATIYVDGTLVTTGPIADIIDNTTALYLGVNNWDTPFNGLVDNLYVYDRCLSADEVASLAKESLTVEAPVVEPDPTEPPAEPTTAPEPTKAPDPTTAPEVTKAPEPTTAPASTDKANESSNTGLIVGIVIAVVVVAGGAVAFVMSKKKK